MARAKRGDVSSFNALVLAYQRQVYNLAYRTLGDRDEAADAVQDAFLSAFRSIDSFRGGSFRAWLFRIAVNACYDRLRRKQRRPAESLEAATSDHPDRDLSIVDPEPGPESQAMTVELGVQLQAGIASLPEDQRAVLVLSDVQGLDYAEISEVLGLPVGTVKSRLSRGRARMREYLVERGELFR